MSSIRSNRGHILRRRARITRSIHEFLVSEGCDEVNVPIMVPSPGLEPHLDAFEVKTELRARYLHTSPEYALKKVLGLGLERIYSMGPCFRDEPYSATHSPQFTMLEWYISGFDLFALMDQTERLIRHVWRTLGEPDIQRNQRTLDLSQPFERLTVRESFLRHVQLDPWLYSDGAELLNVARAQNLTSSHLAGDWDDIFFELFLNHVEPFLGQARPVFLWGWPKSQAALSRIDPQDPSRSLRFELFAGGFELANAFDELVDPHEQRARFVTDQRTRERLGKEIYPIDDDLIDALEHMAPTAGIALGVDRLVMLLLGCETIREVIVDP